MLETAMFLKHVLPTQGYYVGVIIVNNQWRHYFFTDINLLAKFLVEHAEKGLTTYYAVASYEEGKLDPTGTLAHLKKLGRSKANVKLIRSYFLDLDTREGKERATYKNRQEAYNHVELFRHTYNLPKPIYVSSG